jgi:hypothetical protein
MPCRFGRGKAFGPVSEVQPTGAIVREIVDMKPDPSCRGWLNDRIGSGAATAAIFARVS